MRSILLPELEAFTEAVDQVFAGSKYMHLQVKENILEKIAEAMANWFQSPVRGDYMGIKQGSSVSGNVWLVALIIGLLVLLYYGVFKKEESQNKGKKILYGEVINEKTKYDGLLDRAVSFERDGNFKEAIRLYFVSILVYMNEKSLSFLDESKTNIEILKELRINGFKGLGLFESIGDYFYYIWYGNKEVTEENLLWYKKKVNDLLMEVKNYHGE